jgi:hypothetical protein
LQIKALLILSSFIVCALSAQPSFALNRNSNVLITKNNSQQFLSIKEKYLKQKVTCRLSRTVPRKVSELGITSKTPRGKLWIPIRASAKNKKVLTKLIAICKDKLDAGSGNGTCVSPPAGYTLIANASDLQAITDPNGHYLLCNDISLSSSFTPLFPNEAFTGILDGNGKTISGLSISQPSTLMVGLMRIIGRSGVVSNLKFLSPSVQGGGVAGTVAGINGGTIRNVTISAASVSSTLPFAGALVSINSGGTISNCTATSTVTSSESSGNPLVGLDGSNVP